MNHVEERSMSPHKQQQQNLGHRYIAPVEHRVIVLRNPEGREIQKVLREEYDVLHRKKRNCSGATRILVDQQINQKADWFNVNVLRGQGPLELHGMTPEMALAAVREKIEKGQNREKFEFITGKGNHSPGNEDRIKKALFEEYERRPRCSIVENQWNTVMIVKKQEIFSQQFMVEET
ncbi:hypothetical protein CAEBREN_04519 [Caenorhabditis brenneri]|uniref:Smr domain-containing protein n=1 Tax=Caenorhabditis brenneri TaxID=135651 RepID=G0N6A6_CAEBE|nr:hypothetical protein CAEBREN_04519 [Caenorhabditis brenneri]